MKGALFEAAEPGTLARFGNAPAHEPGLDFIRADICFGELGKINPYKVDIVFDAGDLLWLGRCRGL